MCSFACGSKPRNIVAFNVAEGWSKDVTAEVSRKVLARALQQGLTLPASTRALVENGFGCPSRGQGLGFPVQQLAQGALV